MDFKYLFLLLLLVTIPASAKPFIDRSTSIPIKVTTLADDLDNPWAVVPGPDNNLYITETHGRIKVFSQGELAYSITGLPDDIKEKGQGGLLDIVFHPNFNQNRWIYLSYSVGGWFEYYTRVTRFTLKNRNLSNPLHIIDGSPGSDGAHFGSRLIFDRKGYLYITLGERHHKEQAQDLSTYYGKVLRLNDDGSVPKDNPFVNQGKSKPEIFTYGHRNPQGMDMHPATGEIYVSEHGPSGYDAPGGGDEINKLIKGGNYGWPIIHHKQARQGMVSPLVEYTPAIAPSGAVFYHGNKFPNWNYDFFYAALRGQALYRLKIKNGVAIDQERLLHDRFGRFRDIASAANGLLYAITTNGRLLEIAPL